MRYIKDRRIPAPAPRARTGPGWANQACQVGRICLDRFPRRSRHRGSWADARDSWATWAGLSYTNVRKAPKRPGRVNWLGLAFVVLVVVWLVQMVCAPDPLAIGPLLEFLVGLAAALVIALAPGGRVSDDPGDGRS